MMRPTADRVELATVVPACTVLVSGVAAVYFTAWQEWVMATYTGTLFVVALVLTVLLVRWHERLDAAERAAAFHRRMEAIRLRPGRVAMQSGQD